tara:strand:+ start:2523 stop:3305 length:783 start_codon:yes stop_codon:yes gene_type:complete
MSTPYKFIQARADYGEAILSWFKKNDWPQGITEQVAKEVNEWEGGPWASQMSTAINGKLDPKVAYFIAKGNFNKYIHAGDFSKIKDQALKEKLEGSKAFTHNNGKPFDGADFFRLFTGLIEVPKKYKQAEGKITDKEIKEYSDLMREHFLKIKRTEMLSPKETWDLFMKQPYTKTMREDDINFLNDVLRDDADLNSQFLMEAAAYYGRCPCMTVLKSMSDVKLSSKFIEFNQRMESYFGGKVNKAKTKIKETPKTKSSKK